MKSNILFDTTFAILSSLLISTKASQSFERDHQKSTENDINLNQIHYDLKKSKKPIQCSPVLFQKLLPLKYSFSTHKVVTEDNYILTIFRVQNKGKGTKFNCLIAKSGSIGAQRPVLLQHGFNADGHSFFVEYTNSSLGFLLADQGFDVWVGNSRGCKFSRQHKSLAIDDRRFWNFSFMQMGMYDVPANLKFISAVKNYQKTIIFILDYFELSMFFIFLALCFIF